MLLSQQHFDISHDGAITVVRAWQDPPPANRAVHRHAVTHARPHKRTAPLGIFDHLSIALHLVAIALFAFGSLAVLIAVPFGLFPGTVFDQITTAAISLFGLLIALGPGGLYAMSVLRGPVEQLRIDRTTGRVDAIEASVLGVNPRMKSAPITKVHVDRVAMDDIELVAIGTRSLFGFQLQIECAAGTGEDLYRTLTAALGRDLADNQGQLA